MRFEPQGYTKNPDIRIAKSIIDYIFRWLGITFLPGYKEATLGAPAQERAGSSPSPAAEDPELSESKPVDKKSGGRGEAKGEGGRGKAEGGEPERAASSSTAAAGSPIPNPKSEIPNGHSNGHANGFSAKLLERAGVLVKTDDTTGDDRNELFASFQSDAPVCDGCGSITVRSGNCYLCYNCGTSMGCS
jgi:ribonucleoside-diphosphate reductase alpha chain